MRALIGPAIIVAAVSPRGRAGTGRRPDAADRRGGVCEGASQGDINRDKDDDVSGEEYRCAGCARLVRRSGDSREGVDAVELGVTVWRLREQKTPAPDTRLLIQDESAVELDARAPRRRGWPGDRRPACDSDSSRRVRDTSTCSIARSSPTARRARPNPRSFRRAAPAALQRRPRRAARRDPGARGSSELLHRAPQPARSGGRGAVGDCIAHADCGAPFRRLRDGDSRGDGRPVGRGWSAPTEELVQAGSASRGWSESRKRGRAPTPRGC